MCTMCVVFPEFKDEMSPDSKDFEMCTMCNVFPPIARTSRCELCVSYYPNLRVKYPPIARTSRCVLCVSYYPRSPDSEDFELCTMCDV